MGGMAVEYWFVKHAVAAPGAQTAAPAGSDLAADVSRLKALVPPQSHTMTDVGYQWANLWFAADKKNWPLARFFFDAARQQIRWTIAIRPVRPLPAGGTVNIRGIFDAIDPSAFATVQLAIEDANSAEFVTAYKAALTACYSCHVSAGMPYLRPMIPTAPPSTLISFDPVAK